MQDVSRLVVSTHLFPWKNRNGSAWMGLDYYSFFSFMGGLFSCVDGREGAAAGRLRWCCKIYLRNESRTPSSAVLVGRLRHSAIIWKEFPAAVAAGAAPVASSLPPRHRRQPRRSTTLFLRRSPPPAARRSPSSGVAVRFAAPSGRWPSRSVGTTRTRLQEDQADMHA
jgi:hypothetical protein